MEVLSLSNLEIGNSSSGMAL